MKVKKIATLPDPQYPTRRQFSDYTTLLGVAAIGLSTVTGLSAPLRTAGVPLPPGNVKSPREQMAEPRPTETNCPIQQTPEARRLGDLAVEPKPQLGGVPPIAPSQATNRQDRLPPVIAATNSASTPIIKDEIPGK